MKAFEEWWHKEGNRIRGPQPERVWQAALNFVKSRIFEHEDALDVIEEELEN